MSLCAVVPAKTFSLAKSRLALVLSPEQRAALAARMLDRVLGVLGQSRGLDGVLVVSDDEEVAAFARLRGAEPVIHAPGLGASVAAGARRVLGRGQGVLVLMADLATLSRDDVDETLAIAADHVVIAPDRHDDGTSALAFQAGHAIPTRFGEPGSFLLHQSEARRLGLPAAILRRPGLALDIDTPDDLLLASP